MKVKLFDTPEKRARIQANFDTLFETCRKTHRGAGGAAFCICGAGCGGSASCSALSVFKTVLTHGDEEDRKELLDFLNWF